MKDLNKALQDFDKATLDFKPGPIISVGDLDSDEIGTGARNNADKPRVELLPVRHWSHLFWTLKRCGTMQLCRAVDALATFQEGNYDSRALLAPIEPTWFDSAVDVFVYGSGKYKMWNWLKGQPWSVPLASAVRHAKAVVVDGEVFDQESGLPHVGHFTCNVIMLAQFATSYQVGNDLPDPKYFGAEVKDE